MLNSRSIDIFNKHSKSNSSEKFKTKVLIVLNLSEEFESDFLLNISIDLEFNIKFFYSSTIHEREEIEVLTKMKKIR